MHVSHLLAMIATTSLLGCSTSLRPAGDPAPDDLPGPSVPAVDDPTNPADPDPTTPDTPSSQARTLTLEEKEALTVALRGVGGLTPFGPFGPLGADATSQLNQVAPILVFDGPQAISTTGSTGGTTYDGVGIQLEIGTCGSADFATTGVLAWRGLDVVAQTVDEVIFVMVDGVDAGIFTMNAAGPNSGQAFIYDAATSDLLFADSGTFELANLVFGAPQPCSNNMGPSWLSATCNVLEGTFDGDLDVMAQSFVNGGTVQRLAAFNIPATRLEIDTCIDTGDTGFPGFPPPPSGGYSACSISIFDGTDTQSIDCTNGSCECEENGTLVGTCTDNACDPLNHCCLAFF